MKTDAQVIEEAKASVGWVEATTFSRHAAGWGDILWEKAQKHRPEICEILDDIEETKASTEEQITRLCILNHYIENIKWHLKND